MVGFWIDAEFVDCLLIWFCLVNAVRSVVVVSCVGLLVGLVFGSFCDVGVLVFRFVCFCDLLAAI